MLDTVTWRINQRLVIEVVRESLKEVLRYIMYYNFCFYLALILNRSWFAVKSLFKFLAFSNIVHQYLMHHFMIVLLWILHHLLQCQWINACGLSYIINTCRLHWSAIYSLYSKNILVHCTNLWGLLEREH